MPNTLSPRRGTTKRVPSGPCSILRNEPNFGGALVSETTSKARSDNRAPIFAKRTQRGTQSPIEFADGHWDCTKRSQFHRPDRRLEHNPPSRPQARNEPNPTGHRPLDTGHCFSQNEPNLAIRPSLLATHPVTKVIFFHHRTTYSESGG